MLPHQFFKLLADETRVRCIMLIARNGQLCVCELTEALEESQPKVSRHLAVLRAHGLLDASRKGQWVFYQIKNDIPDWATKQIENLLASKCLLETYQKDIERLTNLKCSAVVCR